MRSLVKALPSTVALPRVMLLASLVAVGMSSMIWMTRLPLADLGVALLSVTTSAMVSLDSVAPG